MARGLFEKEVYIRFAEEPMAFVCTIKYGGFTVKSTRLTVSRPGRRSAAAHGPLGDAWSMVKQLLGRPRSRVTTQGRYGR
jgi:hypothetical protein